MIAFTPLTATADPNLDASSAAPTEAVEDSAGFGNAKAAPADTLPFDRVSSSEIEAQAGAASAPPAPSPPAPFMRPDGVEDPFPDRAPRVRPHNAAVLLTLGFGLAAAGAVMGRLTLLPECEDENDVTTCAIPSRGDIGIRSSRLFGAVAFGVGGAALGAFGGRELGRYLQQESPTTLERRRRIAVGIGSASVAIGVAGIVVGSAVLGVGVHRSLQLSETFESVDAQSASAGDLARLDETIDQVRTARAGLMILVAAPTFLATGVSLLVHRPRRRVSVSPQLGRTRFGVNATVRF